MWLSFTELDKAVVHVIRLGSCLWLWFQSVCPLMSSLSAYHLTGVSLTLDVGVSLHSCSSKVQLLLLTLDLGYLLTATDTDLGCGVSSHDKMWSTGEGNGKPLPYSCLENPMNSMKRQKYRTLKDDLPRSVGVQYATGDQWRNNYRKNEGMEPKQKQHPFWMWLVIEARSDAVKSNVA